MKGSHFAGGLGSQGSLKKTAPNEGRNEWGMEDIRNDFNAWKDGWRDGIIMEWTLHNSRNGIKVDKWNGLE